MVLQLVAGLALIRSVLSLNKCVCLFPRNCITWHKSIYGQRIRCSGLALTPPCGLNSYMSGHSGEVFLQSIADFFVESGMRDLCFKYGSSLPFPPFPSDIASTNLANVLCYLCVIVNSDEGWEMGQRNSSTHELMWDPNQYPSGIPAFAARLASAGIHLGLYGAASGVTCGGVSGQLGYEDLDMRTIADWGVSYWKSDNCASYAMDSSVRFAGIGGLSGS